MQGAKADKKIIVMTKTMNKKPHLEINTLQDPDSVTKSAPLGFPNFTPEEFNQGPPKTVSTLASPKNFKAISEAPQVEETPKSKKKLDPAPAIQKRGSGKQITSPRVQVQPRMSANLLASPKAALHKQKVLISYGSEKNLNAIKPLQKKQTPQGKTSAKIEQLQRLLGQEKTRTSLLMTRDNQLCQTIRDLQKQNGILKEQITELNKKVEKYKQLNQQTKKMLRQRIHSFNEEGGELQALRNHIKTLEERLTTLLQENQSLKLEINKHTDLSLSNIKLEGNLAVSTVREVTPLQGSRVNGLYLKETQEGGDLKQFNGLQNVQQNLQLHSYITEKEESYLDEYKTNVDIFDKVKKEYEQILTTMELKYKNLAEDYEQTIASQASDIYELQMKLANSTEIGSNIKLSIGLDEAILKAQQQLAGMNLALFELKSANKELVEQAEHHKAHCRLLQAQLEVQILKKQFKDQNHQFQSNVAKLNLLNIIDKLKIQVERERQKYQQLLAKFSSSA